MEVDIQSWLVARIFVEAVVGCIEVGRRARDMCSLWGRQGQKSFAVLLDW